MLKFVTSATSSGLDLVKDEQMNDLHSLIGLVSKKLVVFVKIESGKTWLVNVGAQDSVLSLKLRVEEREGIPRGLFSLRSHGKDLYEKQRVEQVLCDGDTVEVFLCLAGGSEPAAQDLKGSGEGRLGRKPKGSLPARRRRWK